MLNTQKLQKDILKISPSYFITNLMANLEYFNQRWVSKTQLGLSFEDLRRQINDTTHTAHNVHIYNIAANFILALFDLHLHYFICFIVGGACDLIF